MLTLILTLFLMSDAQAQTPTPAPAKKGPNTNLFEQDPEPAKAVKTQTLTAKVKVVREESDGVEVFFDGAKNGGTYYLYRSIENYATHLKALEDSKKPQGKPVKVTFDADKRIKSVEKIKFNDPTSDPNKKWDFNEVPE